MVDCLDGVLAGTKGEGRRIVFLWDRYILFIYVWWFMIKLEGDAGYLIYVFKGRF